MFFTPVSFVPRVFFPSFILVFLFPLISLPVVFSLRVLFVEFELLAFPRSIFCKHESESLSTVHPTILIRQPVVKDLDERSMLARAESDGLGSVERVGDADFDPRLAVPADERCLSFLLLFIDREEKLVDREGVSWDVISDNVLGFFQSRSGVVLRAPDVEYEGEIEGREGRLSQVVDLKRSCPR